MPKYVPIKYEEFLQAIKLFKIDLKDQIQFVYSVYSYTVEGIDDLAQTKIFGDFQGINHLELIGYCIGEVLYCVSSLPKEKIDTITNDEQIIMSISSMVADKYLSLNQFSYNEGSLTSRFSPVISTLYVYVNFMLNIVKNYNKKDPTSSLLADLFMKSINICRCTLDLIIRGFETEAFSCWRTLHECECALIVLINNGPAVLEIYLRHMKYGLAFRDTMVDKDKQTEIFMSMKEEMKKYDLKSKDIKKFIEYGWLYSVPGVKEDDSFKLNFRDGLEKVAGLTDYAKRYEMSSEIIHGTPLLVYSNREYFYFLTLLSTYESFFRLEQIFTGMVGKFVNEELFVSYDAMRKVYYSQLVNLHKRELSRFKSWQANK